MLPFFQIPQIKKSLLDKKALELALVRLSRASLRRAKTNPQEIELNKVSGKYYYWVRQGDLGGNYRTDEILTDPIDFWIKNRGNVETSWYEEAQFFHPVTGKFVPDETKIKNVQDEYIIILNQKLPDLSTEENNFILADLIKSQSGVLSVINLEFKDFRGIYQWTWIQYVGESEEKAYKKIEEGLLKNKAYERKFDF